MLVSRNAGNSPGRDLCIVVGHDFVDVAGSFVGVVVIQRQESFETLIGFPAN
jgi:hypothetical protein